MLHFGLPVALAILVADQVSKLLLIDYVTGAGGAVEVAPFFDLVMVWNTGVSFGMFQSGEGGWWVLSLLSLAIATGLLFWLRRAESRWLAVGLGAVIGGALGNVVDRIAYGAVADFFDLHVAGYHWPAFNIADSAIVVGVGLLILDSLFTRDKAVK